MRSIDVFAALLCIVLLASLATADVPLMINYQGRVTDDQGEPVSGNVSVVFRIYDADAGGNILWQETHTDVAVLNGLLNVTLGQGTPPVAIDDAVFTSSDCWLGISVGGDPEIVPRTRLVSVPYSHRISTVEGAAAGEISGILGISPSLKKGGRYGSGIVVTGSFNDSVIIFPTDDIILRGTTDDGDPAILMTTITEGGVTGGVVEVTSSDAARDINRVQIKSDGIYFLNETRSDTNMIIHADGSIIGKGVLSMGLNHATSGDWSNVMGFNNEASGDSSVVCGGYDNIASGYAAVIAGGAGNNASGYVHAFIGGGYDNVASGGAAVIGGGAVNTASDNWATVSGGWHNIASNIHATVGGGQSNIASAEHAVIAGGGNNTADSSFAAIGGGWNNRAGGIKATVGGGQSNTASGEFATVAGGANNIADSNFAAIGGGWNNSASGPKATVPGGLLNTASGAYSLAAGRRAKANHEGAFVWGDGTDADFASTAENQFLIRAGGGMGINTNSPAAALEISNGALRLSRESAQYLELYDTSGTGGFVKSVSRESNKKSLRLQAVHDESGSPAGAAKILFEVGGQSSPTTAMVIDENGNVAIGNLTPPVDLYVNGDFTVTGTCSGCSDIRYKKNIVRLDRALEKISRMRGVNFDWRVAEFPDYEFAKTRQIGFIAQELREIVPEVVVEGDDGYLAIDYGRLTPVLVEAIKALKAENEEIKAKLVEMQTMMNQLLENRE